MNLSIGIIETTSIARGYAVADAMVKTASVELVEATPICPGKFIVVVSGSVSSVSASVEAGAASAGDSLIDRMELASIHPDVPAALRGNSTPPAIEALGILETFTASAGVLAADAAVKSANVSIIELRLSRGMGGKAYFTVTGSVSSVSAAIDAASASASASGQLVSKAVIPSPHSDLKGFVL
ncbi:MAG: BMC domain-containing protein [Spirochaetes bacterium]|nr:BMC domain-containing protein [Spirochaetota bacterium]